MPITEKPWNDRPFDVSNLLNPAFGGMILRRAVDGYFKETDQGMPFEIAVLPMSFVLHEDTRSRLPTIAATLQTWLQENRDLMIGFAKRTRELVPFMRESLIFSATRRTLELDSLGSILPGSVKLRGHTAYRKKSDEVSKIFSKSEFLGRWLATAGSSTTIYAMLGIKP
ncbi:MAG: three component ABC system middle component [Rubripirellula sp.]